MSKGQTKLRQLQERIRILSQLIKDGNLSKEKEFELQLEHCYLLRELEIFKRGYGEK
ncbi:MAG: hypothetical protein H8E12_10505 [Rhodobacteraceae bacterium]|nr:hypothetical protein [Paracoccaceae bacterium]